MAFDIGPKIGIEGEKEFRNAISQINTQIKTLGTEMAAATAQFAKNEDSVEALTRKGEILNSQIDAQKEKVNGLYQRNCEAYLTTLLLIESIKIFFSQFWQWYKERKLILKLISIFKLLMRCLIIRFIL